jgi:hypothetical protein
MPSTPASSARSASSAESSPFTRIGNEVIDRSDGRSAQVSEDRENTSRNVSTAARGYGERRLSPNRPG